MIVFKYVCSLIYYKLLLKKFMSMTGGHSRLYRESGPIETMWSVYGLDLARGPHVWHTHLLCKENYEIIIDFLYDNSYVSALRHPVTELEQSSLRSADRRLLVAHPQKAPLVFVIFWPHEPLLLVHLHSVGVSERPSTNHDRATQHVAMAAVHHITVDTPVHCVPPQTKEKSICIVFIHGITACQRP